jgi:hypothetical protein
MPIAVGSGYCPCLPAAFAVRCSQRGKMVRILPLATDSPAGCQICLTGHSIKLFRKIDKHEPSI